MITRRTLAGTALGGAAGVALTGLRPARSAEATPIRVGVLNDVSGPLSDHGGAGSAIACRLAAEDFGHSLLGRPIEVIQADHQNKPDLATSIAREWIDRQGVSVIVDGGSSAAGLAIQQVTREKGRIFLIAAPATSDLTGKACSPFGFNFCYDTYALAKGTATALTAQGADTWYFITADYAFGHALERDASSFVNQAGGKVLGSSRYPFGSNDFSSYLLQAQSSGAKAIGLASSGEDLQNLIKQAAEFGIMHGPQRIAALLIFINDIVALGQASTQGLVLTTSFYWDPQ